MTARETTFSELMAGSVRLRGQDGERPMRLDLDVASPGLLVLWGDTDARLTGRVTLPGVADDPAAHGTLLIAPVRRRRLRYQLDFHATDGRPLHLDGWKSVRLLRPLHSMTTLPATVYEVDGSVLGEALLHFDVRDLPRFLAGFRYRRARAAASADDSLWTSRWRGQPGRLEVWYTTFTDPTSGTGAWLHHEIVAPDDGGKPYLHGWIAVFPPDEPPVVSRFGPYDVVAHRDGDVFAATGLVCRPERLSSGLAGDDSTGGAASWSLDVRNEDAPLFTFPKWAWRREALPAAQFVATPGARFTGSVRIGARDFTFRDAPGASSRIFGHGNAQRWSWLHADLGDGAVLEIVSAVSTLPLLRRLRPLTFIRLRTADGDWPARAGLLTAVRMRARIGLPTWSVRGRVGDRRITVDVRMPEAQTLALDYAEPRGERVVCRNSERADVTVTTERRAHRRWTAEHRWTLHATAHAEVGGRE
jgi:hypothetical protein